VRDALSSLPTEQRAPIEMGFFGGVTHQEIARQTGTPLGTVKTRIRAGLRTLRNRLGEGVPK
jgi:RNA polymerase sigma-70 factor (ECF subfamily)